MTTILPWPYWTGNPYLPRFVAGLQRAGLRVRRSLTLAGGAARLGRGDWIHLHWPGAKVMHRSRALYSLSLRLFRWLLDRARARGVRIAWTAHNLLPHDDPHPDLAREARAVLLRAVDHVFVHFPGARDALARELGHRGPTTEIPHGHYLDDYPAPPSRREARTEVGVPEAGQVALLFGQLRPYKGIGEAVEGFLAAARPEDRLIVAGRPEGDVGRELAAARRDPRVIVLARHIGRDEVARLFAAADVALIAHTQFFTSGSAVLALSMGCPIAGRPVHHLAHLPHLVAIEPGAAGVADGLVRARELRVDRATLRAWARRELSWATASERAARVFRG